jgi:hypothetical protein
MQVDDGHNPSTETKYLISVGSPHHPHHSRSLVPKYWYHSMTLFDGFSHHNALALEIIPIPVKPICTGEDGGTSLDD